MSKSGSKIREQVAHFLVDIHTAGILDESAVDKGKAFVASQSEQTIPADLTEDELAEVKKFVDFLISKRK